jgi:hypothetical protein
MPVMALKGYLWTPGNDAVALELDHGAALGYETLFTDRTAGPRVVVADSVSYGADRLTNEDVLLAASYAGKSSLVFALRRGLRGVIAHEAGVGLDRAGISGLALCDAFGVPAAAVATMEAGLSHGASMVGARITHANACATALGVAAGMPAWEAGRLMLKSPPGRNASAPDVVDPRLHRVAQTESGAVYASDSTFGIKQEMLDATICGGSHCARVFAESILKIRPRGAMANDAGMGRDRSGVEGLSVLSDHGIAGASVAALSARIGNGISTYNDGVISSCYAVAATRGVVVGMPARQAAEVMLRA